MLKDSKFSLICRMALGVVFMVSAYLKYKSVDSFELYIYGFDWFSLAVSSQLARLLLFTEMFLGTCLVAGIYAKWATRASAFLLSFFSVFLLYLAAIGDDGNCHCFGDVFELNPLESLAKNLVLGVLLFFAWNRRDWTVRRKYIFLVAALLGSLFFAFVLKAPYGYSPKENTFSSVGFAHLADSFPVIKNEDKMVLAFVSTGCKHCKMAVRKLDLTLRHLDHDKFKEHWFVLGTETSFKLFLEDTKVQPAPYAFLSGRKLLSLTQGKIPVIMLVRRGEVVRVMSNATYNEHDIVEFVNGN